MTRKRAELIKKEKETEEERKEKFENKVKEIMKDKSFITKTTRGVGVEEY